MVACHMCQYDSVLRRSLRPEVLTTLDVADPILVAVTQEADGEHTFGTLRTQTRQATESSRRNLTLGR